MPHRKPLLFAALALGLALTAFAQNPIHVTYLWHMHQPNYYPYNSVNDIDSWGLFNFSVADVHNTRAGPYGEWPKNAVQQSHDRNMPHAGVQVSFSGSLMENLDGLWGHGWREHYRWARNGLRTARGNPRLDVVGFANHHSLMPLTSRESMIMQIRLHKEAYQDVWNAGDGSYSKGFFPPESSFAMHMVPALVNQGIEWVLVDSGHIDRTLEDFPWSDASSIRPNRADMRNGTVSDWNSQWTQLNNVWAPTPVAAPFSYQPHRIRYVDPNSDPSNPTVYEMIAVPAARYEGNENARGGYGAFKPQNVWQENILNRNNDPTRPMMIVCHSDGDNFGMLNADAYHGQHGQFLDMVQANANFAHTSIQDYLGLFPVPADSPYIHCEPGSWIGIDGGTPFFNKWVEDNARDGEHPDLWNWSVLIAAQNRVIHADSLESGYSMNDVRWGIGSDTAKAWRNYLVAETSCYWYWDFDRANPWDGNVTRAANLSITEAHKVLARHPGVDTVGPSIFPPQRPIWNPGGKHWNEAENQPSDFDVWTFVDDASGVASVNLMWRTADWNSYVDLNDFANELYAHTPGKNSPWNTVSMGGGEWYPSVRGPHVPDPLSRAKRYTGTIAGQSDVLISYYIEATDTQDNVSRSEIFHVWVGEDTGGGNGGGPRVEFDPPAPDGCTPVTIRYRKDGSPLGSGQVYIHIGRNGWQDVADPSPAMTDDGDFWTYVYSTPEDTAQIDVVFHDGAGNWDNNNSMDWHLTIVNCGEGGGVEPGPTVAIDPPAPDGCGPIAITYDPAGRDLSGASQVYIHIGHNGWQDVILPNPAMALDAGKWTYVYTPPPGTEQINMVFNNGAATWDNNAEANWNFSVTNCDDDPPLPVGLFITSPAGNTSVGHATATYDLVGTGEGLNGHIQWANSLTGAEGAIPAAALWSIPGIALDVGANVITVQGSNVTAGGGGTLAEDTGANYAGEWNDGSNNGSGFGPWAFNHSQDGETSWAGVFIGPASAAGITGMAEDAFGFYGNPADVGANAEVMRDFSTPMAVGSSFRFQWGLNYDSDSETSYRGFVLLAGETELINLSMGNSAQISINGDPMFSNYGAQAMTLNFEYLASGSIRVWGTGRDGSETYDQTLAVPEGAPSRIKFYFNGATRLLDPPGEEDHRQMYVDHLNITVSGEGGVEFFDDTVTITRQASGGDPEPPVIGDIVLDISGNSLEIGLAETLPGAEYALYECQDLLAQPQVWTKIDATVQIGDGGALVLELPELLLPYNHYRIGVIAP